MIPIKIANSRKRLDELKSEQRIRKEQLKDLTTKLEKTQVEISEIENVQKLFQSAVSLMYDNLSTRLGDIITEGLSTIFPDSGYKFCIEFTEKRNNVEAEIFLQDADGNRYSPLDDVGGGVVDLINLLLRITYIILSPYENVIFADEPLKYVDRSRIEEAAKFIRKLCEDFDFKIIMVTHIPEIMEESNAVYIVQKTKGVSVVKKLDK